MTPRGVLVVGAGKRVRETALPAFRRCGDLFEVRRVLARSARTLEAAGRDWEVTPLEALRADEVAACDLVYLAVGKDAVPQVLARFAELGVGGQDLLIDTPVVRFKHYRHVARIAAFRNAWVAEDCVELPWIDCVRAAAETDVLGPIRRVVFDRSAYAYHGVATAKALLGDLRVKSGRRRRRGNGGLRTLRFAGGGVAEIVEPRDYAAGRILVEGDHGALSDRPESEGATALEPILADGELAGFRAGAVETHLDPQERELVRGDPAGASVIARQEALKRVGFLRLLRRIHAGRGAYALEEAVDDMVVDYHLEKVGLWAANPFTSPRSGLGRLLLSTLSRLGG